MKLLAVMSLFLFTACGTKDDPGPAAVCTYDFSASTIDTSTWNVYQQPPTTISQRDNQLVIDLVGNAVAYSTLYSVATDFRGSSVAAELGEVPVGVGAESLVQLAVGDRQRHYMAVEDGRLYAGNQVDDRYDAVDIGFDPVAHRFLRLSAGAIDGRMLYETSPDGTTWTPQYDTRLVLPLDQAYFEFGAGTYAPAPSPGRATFRSATIEGNCAP